VTEFLGIFPKLGSGARSSLVAESGAETPASGKFEICVVNKATGAAANPPAAGANERVSFIVAFNVGV
jgi:MFS superfamily sulfate permease-like transporter